MIGVISRPDQTAVVEEFFELFKTPWEFYRPNRSYDVVLATSAHVPALNTRLLLVYGATPSNTDASTGVEVNARQTGAPLNFRGSAVPIYGQLATFKVTQKDVLTVATAAKGVSVIQIKSADRSTLRIGYDLFDEVRHLISSGQPPENALTPTLDLHIKMLRDWILDAGVALIEIPPIPAGHSFAACLTHDIDFVGIRNHKFDHTMWGFLYRSSIGAIRDLLRGRIGISRLLRIWRAAASLPFVYLGWAKDFWEPFAWYLEVEKDLPATHFLIPFKRARGDKVPGRHAARRATAYDVTDLATWTTILQQQGCELGVHGIDAWHSASKGRAELARIAAVTNSRDLGIRMHWLMQDSSTPSILEEAGYAYDSSRGYNETVGYRSGTTQVYRPSGAKTLLELPLHIQDGALFYPNRLDLSEPEAENRCKILIANAQSFGGVLTVLWHDRSHGPERFWGDFYIGLVRSLKSLNPWFGTASQIVRWFRGRRAVRFGLNGAVNGIDTAVSHSGDAIHPPLRLRLHQPSAGVRTRHDQSPSTYVDIAWSGRTTVDVDSLFKRIAAGRSVSPQEVSG